MIQDITLTMLAGQPGVIKFTSISGYGDDITLAGAAKIRGESVPFEATADTLTIPALPPGVWRYAVLINGSTAWRGSLMVEDSPLFEDGGQTVWAGNVIKSDDVVSVSLVFGVPGQTGASAYELAVANGYDGTEAEWIAELQGAQSAANAAKKSEAAAADSARDAAGSATAAADNAQASASSAASAAGAAADAATSVTEAGNSADAAAGSAAAAADSAGKADEQRRLAALARANAELAATQATENAAEALTHITNSTVHVTATEHEHLRRLIAAFPEVDPDTPGTPEPELPDTALSYAQVRDYFAKNAQPGTAQAPPAVYVSRVPWARWDEDSAQWLNNASEVDEMVFSAPRKFLDNAGLEHECSTDTVEGADDYVGKLWPFFWQHGNYVTDEYGVKHLTSIKGQVLDGVSFDAGKPVAAFGPSFWFFCCLERWQNPETGQWTTADGTESGEPLYQLWGISARAWDDLDESRQEELAAHGVTAEDFHLWPECCVWDATDGAWAQRPYWIHSAYCGGYEVSVDGTESMVSKPGLPLYNNLSHKSLIAMYGRRSGFGGSAAVNGFGMLFDIVKNATKNSQSIHTGMSSNICGAVKAALSTAQADYVFPISSQSHFRVGCTVWLWQTANGSGGTTYKRSAAVQIGRIQAIETRTLTLDDGSSTDSLCLVIDPATVEPFLVRTGADSASAIEATKKLTDAGTYACCFATQGMAMTGETDAVIGRHDGSMTSNTDGRHPYRVQGTEYMSGIYTCAADVQAIKGDSVTDVEVDGVVSIPTSRDYVILQCRHGGSLRTSGTLAQYVGSGYVPVGIAPVTSGYILNVQLSAGGVAYPVAVGGTGSGSGTGHADSLTVGASPAEFLMGSDLQFGGVGAGSACIYLSFDPGYSSWFIGARD